MNIVVIGNYNEIISIIKVEAILREPEAHLKTS